MVVDPVVKSTKSASECNNGQAKMKVHLAPVKALLSTAILRTRSQSVHFVTRLRLVAVQELNWELTVFHSIKLVKAMMSRFPKIAAILPFHCSFNSSTFPAWDQCLSMKSLKVATIASKNFIGSCGLVTGNHCWRSAFMRP